MGKRPSFTEGEIRSQMSRCIPTNMPGRPKVKTSKRPRALAALRNKKYRQKLKLKANRPAELEKSPASNVALELMQKVLWKKEELAADAGDADVLCEVYDLYKWNRGDLERLKLVLKGAKNQKPSVAVRIYSTQANVQMVSTNLALLTSYTPYTCRATTASSSASTSQA